ncbi:MAG TPA: DUF4142 domain-containing protein [Polyangia bacterium]|nr:DUF4142 domain-containing protein [Polyangia bacterium]
MGSARAQIWPGTPVPARPDEQSTLRRLSLTDQGFARAAATTLPAQAQLGLLAEDRGDSPAVRAMGRRLAHEHHELGFELSRVAENEHLALPSAPPPSDQPRYLQLQSLSGRDFDRAFLDQQRLNLAEESELFETEATSGTHSTLRAFAHRHRRQLHEDKKLATIDRHRE